MDCYCSASGSLVRRSPAVLTWVSEPVRGTGVQIAVLQEVLQLGTYRRGFLFQRPQSASVYSGGGLFFSGPGSPKSGTCSGSLVGAGVSFTARYSTHSTAVNKVSVLRSGLMGEGCCYGGFL